MRSQRFNTKIITSYDLPTLMDQVPANSNLLQYFPTTYGVANYTREMIVLQEADLVALKASVDAQYALDVGFYQCQIIPPTGGVSDWTAILTYSEVEPFNFANHYAVYEIAGGGQSTAMNQAVRPGQL